MLKITIKKDFRNLKQGTIYDFSDIDDMHYLIVSGENGCGKSSIFHALRGTKIDNKSYSIKSFGDLKDNVEVEHNYDRILFLDSVIDNPADFNVAYDAVNYVESGGFEQQYLSHGQKTLSSLGKFFKDNENNFKNSLIILDEVDKGLSLANQAKFANVIDNLVYKHKAHVICITHNVFTIQNSMVVFDFEKNELMSSEKYILEKTNYKLQK